MKQAAPHRQSHRVSRHINPPSLAGHECLLVGFDGVGHANRYTPSKAESPPHRVAEMRSQASI